MSDTPKDDIFARLDRSGQTGWATRNEVAAHWKLAPRTIREWNRLPPSDPKHLPWGRAGSRVRIAWAAVRQYEAINFRPGRPGPATPRRTRKKPKKP
jgi:hypothetical protein